MAGVVLQDVYEAVPGFDFMANPTNGVNRLVSTFTIIEITGDILQDTYTSGATDIVQDVYDD